MSVLSISTEPVHFAGSWGISHCIVHLYGSRADCTASRHRGSLRGEQGSVGLSSLETSCRQLQL